MHEITTAITIWYFDAILKEYTKIISKFLCDNDRNSIFSSYVTAIPDPPPPDIFVMVCHESSETTSPPLPLHSYHMVPNQHCQYILYKGCKGTYQCKLFSIFLKHIQILVLCSSFGIKAHILGHSYLNDWSPNDVFLVDPIRFINIFAHITDLGLNILVRGIDIEINF